MAKPLPVLAVPCRSCPYRRDTPPGVWEPEEYEKLRRFAADFDHADGLPSLNVFLCHQTNATGRRTVCRGWLAVERDSLAVQVALCQGRVTPEQVYARIRVPLYATGEEAAAAGLAGIEEPSPEAERMVARLLRKGAGRK